MPVRWNILGKTWRTIWHSTLRCHYQKKINSPQQTTMKEKQKGENRPSSKKRGFDQGTLVGGGKGDDDIKYRQIQKSNSQNKSNGQIDT